MGSLTAIDGLDEYLKTFGRTLGVKAIATSSPLHVPGAMPLGFEWEKPWPEGAFFEGRTLYEPQAHAVQAIGKMFDSAGNGFIAAEMGTGKSIIGCCAVHVHAAGKPYRAIVLCPDHLIDKWCREIETTIPGISVRTFKSEVGKDGKEKTDWRTFLPLLDKSRPYVKDTGKGIVHRKRWAEPDGAEWYVMGRNQVKWLPKKLGMGTGPHHCFDGMDREFDSAQIRPAGKTHGIDENGKKTVTKLTTKQYRCPTCGKIVRDRAGEIVRDSDYFKTMRTCDGTYLKEIPDPKKNEDDGTVHQKAFERFYSSAKGMPIPDGWPYGPKEVGRAIKWREKSWRIMKCGEPLWSFTNKPYRWPPATLVKKKMRRMFDYLIIDEVHEQKSDTAAQSMACGALLSSVKHVLAMTGTLIGGYADDLFPLLVRMAPKLVTEEGFEWGKEQDFIKKYGKIDKIVSASIKGGAGFEIDDTSMSLRRSKTGAGQTYTRWKAQPGIMPTLFSRHLIGQAVFLSLEEMDDDLPLFFEYPGGPPIPLPGNPTEEERAWHEEYLKWHTDTACVMDEEQESAYKTVESTLHAECARLLITGSMKLLGTFLHTTLGYPDRPFDWKPDARLRAAINAAREAGLEFLDTEILPIGYWGKPGLYKLGNWTGVVQPPELDQETIRPKEAKLLEIVIREKLAGNQCWIYVQMTQKRDVQARLKSIMEARGLRVCILDPNEVAPIDREAWIVKTGRHVDVMISHPKPVSTGLDLFAKDGGHNFSTLIFYQTGYSLFDMRQAARRAWRISQPKTCKVYYLYYKNTMQQRAMNLMSRKMAAAIALEGEFSSEGLAAMAGEDNEQMAMARSLSVRIDDQDIQRNWSKAGAKRTKVKILGTKTWPAAHEAARELAYQLPLPEDWDVEDLFGMAPQLKLVGEVLAAKGQPYADPRGDDEIPLEDFYDDDPEGEESLELRAARAALEEVDLSDVDLSWLDDMDLD